ncbi:MAG TPA: hypothetical protein VIX59_19075, partial [Candidatus Binataceae bacterium]
QATLKSPDSPPNPDAEVMSPPVDDLGPPVPVSPNQNLPSPPGITAPGVPLDFSNGASQTSLGAVLQNWLVPDAHAASASDFESLSITDLEFLKPNGLEVTWELNPTDAAGAAGNGFVAVDQNWLITFYKSGSETFTTGGQFWNALYPSECHTYAQDEFQGGFNSICNWDPRIIYDRVAARWVATAGQGIFTTDFANGTAFNAFIAVSDTADPTGTWHEFMFPACNKAPSGYQLVDMPTLAINGQWILVEGHCANSTSVSYEQINAIEKPSLYSGTLINHPMFDSFVFDAPLTSINGDNEAYFADVATKDGSYSIHWSKLTGPIASPQLIVNALPPVTITVPNTKSGGSNQQVPDVDQASCTHCLSHASNFSRADGSNDEDTRANGDKVLELSFNQKYGGSTDAGTADGGAVVEVLGYDIIKNSMAFAYFTNDSLTNGTTAHVYPSVSHAVISGSDYVFLTDTLATNKAHPTAEYRLLLPSLQSLDSRPSDKDALGKVGAGNRWGDYSTSVFASATGQFVGFNMIVDYANSTNCPNVTPPIHCPTTDVGTASVP